MIFEYPILLFLFLIFIPILILDVIAVKKRQKLINELEKKLRISALLFRLFIIFAIIAMAGPKWGMGYAPSEFRRGLDIVFAIDVSRSMDIRDAKPDVSVSRLEQGLLIAQETINSVTGARYAAATGRGRGYLTVPLTFDTEAALIFLESVDDSSMTGRSTNLESLIEAALSAFQNTSAARRFIILISDGEAHSGILRNALNRSVREGVIVSTIAVGSDEGRPIPAQLNDPNAEMVISRREANIMRAAAERTGGIYIDGSRDDASSALSSFLLSFSQETEVRQTEEQSGTKEPKQRRTLFIILSILFYAASKFITRTRKIASSHISAALVVFSVIFFSSCSEGKLLLLEANFLNSRNRHNEAIELYLKALNYEDASAYAEYGLGLALYSLDDYENSLKRYENSQKILETQLKNEASEESRGRSARQVHRELRFRNHYNSGVVLFEEGDYNLAAAAFKEALRADPNKMEAKQNLELSLLSISLDSNRQQQTEERQEQREILFDYIKQEEEQKWRSREWEPEEHYTGLDY